MALYQIRPKLFFVCTVAYSVLCTVLLKTTKNRFLMQNLMGIFLPASYPEMAWKELTVFSRGASALMQGLRLVPRIGANNVGWHCAGWLSNSCSCPVLCAPAWCICYLWSASLDLMSASVLAPCSASG